MQIDTSHLNGVMIQTSARSGGRGAINDAVVGIPRDFATRDDRSGLENCKRTQVPEGLMMLLDGSGIVCKCSANYAPDADATPLPDFDNSFGTTS